MGPLPLGILTALLCLPATRASAAVAAAAAGADLDLDGPEPLAAALRQGDECAEADGQSGQCALSALQLRAQRANRTLAEEQSGAPICPSAAASAEGQTCVPNPNPAVNMGHSFERIYCSGGRNLSPQPIQCSAIQGPMSWCVPWAGVGLAHDQCDDPFCRNGGAAHGNGKYCHQGAIVDCNGKNAPIFVDPCNDQTYTNFNGCKVTDHYTCVGGWPNPYCRFTNQDVKCN